MLSMDVDAIEPMQPMQSQATDTEPLPRRYRTWLALTGLTDHQFRSVQDRPPDPTGCWAPLGTAAVRPAAVGTDPLAHQPDHPGTGRLVRHQPIHPGPDHRPPGAGAGCRAGPTADCSTHPWIIDATLIPVHDQSITAITKNYRRSVNTQILINANRRVIAVGPCWPANRNDVIVARRTVAHLLDGTRPSNRQPGSSATTTTANTGVSAPASNTSPPRSKTGKSCDNADDAAKPSTTASTPSPDSGTSRTRDNYGSTARQRLLTARPQSTGPRMFIPPTGSAPPTPRRCSTRTSASPADTAVRCRRRGRCTRSRRRCPAAGRSRRHGWSARKHRRWPAPR
jgi:hypothetical protein